MLIFTAFNSAQNMVAQVYANLGYDDLGNIALFTIYFIFSITSFFGSRLVQCATPKIVFFLSALGYNSFIFAGYIAVNCPEDNDDELPKQCGKTVLYSYIIFTSVLLGFSAATIWVIFIKNYIIYITRV